MTTCFQNAILVQLDPLRAEVGNLRQEEGKIVAVGAEVVAAQHDEIVDCDGAVLMPGLVNGHTHLYSALAPGMPPPPQAPRNFHERLQFVWWRLDRAHTLESVQTSGQVGALAALHCGTTTLIDHHASPHAIDGSLSAVEDGVALVGCRGVLCYEVTDRNAEDEAPRGLKENQRYVAACKRQANGRFAGMIGAHASFTLKEQSLAACAELANQMCVGLHIHVAEDPVDERLTRQRFGSGLIERLQRHGVLDLPNTILAHGTHFSESDFSVVNSHLDSIHVAHNPNSNMNNGVGYTATVRLTTPPLLGTDGIGSNMWGEARTAQFKSHDAHAPLTFGQPLQMLAESARFASRCLGVTLGQLEPGAAADLVLTDYRPAAPLSADNFAAHFLFAMGPEFVKHVMIDGRWCLRDGRVVSCDEPRVRARSVSVAAELHRRMAAL